MRPKIYESYMMLQRAPIRNERVKRIKIFVFINMSVL